MPARTANRNRPPQTPLPAPNTMPPAGAPARDSVLQELLAWKLRSIGVNPFKCCRGQPARASNTRAPISAEYWAGHPVFPVRAAQRIAPYPYPLELLRQKNPPSSRRKSDLPTTPSSSDQD